MRVRFINPRNLHEPPSYTHVIRIDKPGSLIFVSGQGAINSKGKLIGVGNIKVQTERAFRNLGEALRSAGADYKDIVKLNTYLSDIRNLAAVKKIRNKYLRSSKLPTVTTFQAEKLARPEFLIEIDAVAVLG